MIAYLFLLMTATAATFGGYHTEAWCPGADDWCNGSFAGIEWEGDSVTDDDHVDAIEAAESVQVMQWGAVAGVDELLWLDVCAPSASNCAEKKLVVVWNDTDDSDLTSALSFSDTGYRPTDGSSALTSPPLFGGYTALAVMTPVDSMVTTTPNTWAQHSVNTWMYLRDIIVERFSDGNLTGVPTMDTAFGVTDHFDASGLVLTEALHTYVAIADSSEGSGDSLSSVTYGWYSSDPSQVAHPMDGTASGSTGGVTGNCAGQTAGTVVDCGAASNHCEGLLTGFGCTPARDGNNDMQCTCSHDNGLIATCNYVGSCVLGNNNSAPIEYVSSW